MPSLRAVAACALAIFIAVHCSFSSATNGRSGEEVWTGRYLSIFEPLQADLDDELALPSRPPHFRHTDGLSMSSSSSLFSFSDLSSSSGSSSSSSSGDPTTTTTTSSSLSLAPRAPALPSSSPSPSSSPDRLHYPVMASVPLQRAVGFGRSYVADLSLGSPRAQRRGFVIQTIASALFVFSSTLCPPSICFNSSQSESFGPCMDSPKQRCTPYYTSCNLFMDSAFFSEAPILAQPKAKLCIATQPMSTYQYPEGVAGSLGLGYLYNIETGPVTSFLPPSWPRIVALDLQADGRPSSLHFGGYEGTNVTTTVTPVRWGERQTHGILFHWFPVHTMSVCGVNLLEEGVGMAIIALDSPCLGLPRVLFQRMMRWLPAYCDKRTDRCYFNSSITNQDRIPSLYITLSHDGEPVHINLADLLFSRAGRKEYCIEDLTYKQTLRLLGQPIIYLGSAVLENFLTVLDFDEKRVGLASKRSPNPDEWCPAPVKCEARQTYEPASNSCIDPECSQYWFQYTDPVTRECQYYLGFKVVVACVIGLLVAAETLLSLANQRLHSRIGATCPNLTSEELQKYFA